MSLFLYLLNIITSALILFIYSLYLSASAGMSEEFAIVHWLTPLGSLFTFGIGSYLIIDFKRVSLSIYLVGLFCAVSWPILLFFTESNILTIILFVVCLLTLLLSIVSILYNKQLVELKVEFPFYVKLVLISIPNFLVIFFVGRIILSNII